jgi:hypothetical protein
MVNHFFESVFCKMKSLLFGLIITPVLALVYVTHNSKVVEVKDVVLGDSVPFFKHELRPDKRKPCFNGAYYRKAVSSKDLWLGIGGTVVLPKITFDTLRRNKRNPGEFLDNPSVYMGGNMNEQETDVGLTWAVVKDEKGNISTERKAFRPFFRRTSYPQTGQKDIWQNAPAQKEFYWYPGQEVKMSLQIVAKGRLRFIVEGAGKHYEAEFESDGYTMKDPGEFKRVNAIDQVGNEGKAAQPTRTRVENSIWKETHLFRSVGGKLVRASMHQYRFTDMRCPDVKYFNVRADKKQQRIGAETISIDGDAR